ncbi:MAG TPA: hypothetical protein VGT05_00905 [Patescibacteria group bacterium]|nr:hypothetical protein [Patescibacteria group bacterium]
MPGISELPARFREGIQAGDAGNLPPGTTEVPLSDTFGKGWQAFNKQGAVMSASDPVSDLGHIGGTGDRKFFDVVGLKKEGSHVQPAIKQEPATTDPQKRAGVGIMLVDRKTGQLLVNYRNDIGDSELGATIQTSYTNLANRDGGIPFIEFTKHPSHYSFAEPADPQRIVKGRVRLGVELIDKEKVDITGKEDSYHWYSLKEIYGLTKENVPANAFFDGTLKLVFSMLDSGQIKPEVAREQPQIVHVEGVEEHPSLWQRLKHWIRRLFGGE